MTTNKLTIVTCSYGPDILRCRRLCNSIDRFVPASVEHCIIVPRRDYPLFRDLHTGRRRVHVTEEVVPGNFRQLPVAKKLWLAPGPWPVRGWLMQQITKLSANFAVDTEYLLFADSDLEMIRPLDEDLLLRNDRLRLHRIPGAMNTGEHLQWHHRAATLIGEQPRYFGGDYVGQLITWRSSNLAHLQEHLEAIHGTPWYHPIARSLTFSEYVLYGAFVDSTLTIESSGHFHCADEICHCCWVPADVTRLQEGKDIIESRAQAVLLQSNLGLLPDQEETLLAQVRTRLSPALPKGS